MCLIFMNKVQEFIILSVYVYCHARQSINGKNFTGVTFFEKVTQICSCKY